LGKLAVEIARKLSGKDKVHYCDQWDCGDYVVVINAGHVATSGNKMEDKVYYKHTGWKGHLREITLGKLMHKKPTMPLELAVKGMLPKNKLRKPRLKRLKLFAGADHVYAGQILLPWNKE
jgi:large subunit ribosomal protein L13